MMRNIRKIDRRQKLLLLTAAGLFAACLALLFCVRKSQGLFCDESDNLLIGRIVAGGKVLYKDVYSQHPPVMYLLAALFAKLGARTVPEFRMAMYVCLSAVWALMFLRYGRYFGRVTMALYPLFCVCLTAILQFGNMVLSEQLESVGLTVLLFEFLLFEKTGELRTGSCVIVSAAVLCAFGTAFIAVYPIFVVALAVFSVELRGARRGCREKGLPRYFAAAALRYGRLLLIVALPFIALVAVSAAQGTLGSAFDQIYRLNRIVYPKYLGGFASSATTLLISPVSSYFTFLKSTLNALTGGSLFTVLLQLILIASNFLFCGVILRRRGALASFWCFLIVIYSGMRGYDLTFHAQPYYEISVAMLAFLLSEWVFRPLRRDPACARGALRVGAAGVVIVLFSTTFLADFHPDFAIGAFSDDMPDRYTADIGKLTQPGDQIFVETIDSLNMYYYLYTDRMPAARVGCLVPWFAEWYEGDVVSDLTANRPKLILYNPDDNIWGYKYRDFAPRLQTYITGNYTRVYDGGKATIEWIRSDYYPQAVLKLRGQG